MKARMVNDQVLFRRLTENNDESATVAMLVQLCRESPELRHWLWEDFGRDAKVRSKLARLVDDVTSPPVGRFVELTPDAASWREERRRLREQMPIGIYGGLAWNQVAQLIRHYQASNLDLGLFLLAHDWRKAGKSSPLHKWAGLALLERIIPTGHRRLLKHLNKALTFLKRYENKASRRSLIGYNDWWKLQVLLHIIHHPQKSYLTRELRAHLATLGLKINTKEIRRFCTRHGIKRDMQAGRPRNATRTKPTAVHSIRPTDTRKGHKAGSL